MQRLFLAQHCSLLEPFESWAESTIMLLYISKTRIHFKCSPDLRSSNRLIVFARTLSNTLHVSAVCRCCGVYCRSVPHLRAAEVGRTEVRCVSYSQNKPAPGSLCHGSERTSSKVLMEEDRSSSSSVVLLLVSERWEGGYSAGAGNAYLWGTTTPTLGSVIRWEWGYTNYGGGSGYR